MSGGSPFIRLALSLVMLGSAILFALDMSGVIGNLESSEMELRAARAESVALRVADAAENHDMVRLRAVLNGAVKQDDELLSAGLRSSAGELLVQTTNHGRHWKVTTEDVTPESIVIPISRRGRVWARLELDYPDHRPGVIAALWRRPLIKVVVCFAGIAFLAYALFLRRVLSHLDPSTVIPPRVKTTLDLMAEGVLLMDRDERIVLANDAFAARCGVELDQLVGSQASQLAWQVPGSTDSACNFPWVAALDDVETSEPVALALSEGGEQRIFMVKGAPVRDDAGRVRGAIATFNEITQLERKSQELEEAMLLLEKSRDEIRLQNDELRVLARCDPLTGVSNRRSFMSFAETAFAEATENGHPLSCIMVDIDHFKLVNDEHGHQIGDTVIQRVAQELSKAFADKDAVCRYGGEEFCLLARETPAEMAVKLAERLRQSIGSPGFTKVPMTASFGVASLNAHPGSLQELIDRADQALYYSKEHGRNRVSLRERAEADSKPDT